MKTASTGSCVSSSRAARGSRAPPRSGRVTQRRDEDRDDRVDRAVAADHARPPAGSARPAPSRSCRPGWSSAASAGRNARQLGPHLVAERRRPRARPASHASAHMIPGPPALVTIATRLPAGQRLAREQRGDVEQLGERVGADHARLAEERVDGHVGGGEQRPGVRGGGARARRRAAALDGDDRLASGRPGGRSARTCAGCRTTRGTAGSASVPVVGLPVLDQVVAGDVGLVADRHERRQAEAELAARSR